MRNQDKIKDRLTPILERELECCEDPDPFVQTLEMPGNEVDVSGYCEECLERFGGFVEFAGFDQTR